MSNHGHLELKNRTTRPMLVAKCDEDLVVYEAFLAASNNTSQSQASAATARAQFKSAAAATQLASQTQINFKRLNHEIIIRDKRLNSGGSKRKAAAAAAQNIRNRAANNENDELEMASGDFFNTRTKQTAMLRAFTNIAGYSGFAIINPACSYFVFFCLRSGLTAHPLWLDGALTAFTPLQNSQITMSGFVYMNRSFDIRIGTLPTADESGKLAVHYDAAWVLRKVQLRQSVHYIVYHEESKCYAVVTSVNEQTAKIVNASAAASETDVKDPNASINSADMAKSNLNCLFNIFFQDAVNLSLS
jgi:hypothetical protein